jgi:thiol-disulfide isomerase/thioredoxin
MVDRLVLTAAIATGAGLLILLASLYQRAKASKAARREGSRGAEESSGLRCGTGSHPRVLYFRSDHCTTCETQARIWAQLDEGTRSLIESVDVEADPRRAKAYGVLTLPTSLVISADDRVVHINHGVVPSRKLLRQLEEAQLPSGMPTRTDSGLSKP